jgi:hypothetical protein
LSTPDGRAAEYAGAAADNPGAGRNAAHLFASGAGQQAGHFR